MPNIVNLPVSIGEALDKLSILYIKLENIKDKRRENVFKIAKFALEKINESTKNSKCASLQVLNAIIKNHNER